MKTIFGEVLYCFNNEFEPDMNPQSNGGSGSAGGCGGSGGCGSSGGGSAIKPPEENS